MSAKHGTLEYWQEVAEAVTDDVRALRAEVERLKARDEEWQRKASAWMASPEAVQRLDGYRELAQRLNAAEAEADRLRGVIEKCIETMSGNGMRDWKETKMLRAAIDAARGES